MTRRTVSWAVIAAMVSLTLVGMRCYLLPPEEGSVRQVSARLPPQDELPQPGQMDVFETRAQLEEAYPGVALDPVNAVDFSREKLVQIGWEGHFCRETPVVCDTRAGGRWVMFHHELIRGRTHDCFCRLLIDRWFAVPAHATPALADTTLLDTAVAVAFLALGAGALAASGLAFRVRGTGGSRPRLAADP